MTCGMVFGASTSLLIESVACPNGIGERLHDWIMKPLCWVLVFGGLPKLSDGRGFSLAPARIDGRRRAGDLETDRNIPKGDVKMVAVAAQKSKRMPAKPTNVLFYKQVR